MTFWAYNPLVGGFVCRHTKQKDESHATVHTSGRYANPIYQALFLKPTISHASSLLANTGAGAKLALTWLRDESLLSLNDCVIIGACSLKQLSMNLELWTFPSLTEKDKECIAIAQSLVDPVEIPLAHFSAFALW